jgi:hypothetical protein
MISSSIRKNIMRNKSMNKFRLSSRLFSYTFWDSVLSNTDPNDGKREILFQELSKLDKLRKKADYNT